MQFLLHPLNKVLFNYFNIILVITYYSHINLSKSICCFLYCCLMLLSYSGFFILSITSSSSITTIYICRSHLYWLCYWIVSIVFLWIISIFLLVLLIKVYVCCCLDISSILRITIGYKYRVEYWLQLNV